MARPDLHARAEAPLPGPRTASTGRGLVRPLPLDYPIRGVQATRVSTRDCESVPEGASNPEGAAGPVRPPRRPRPGSPAVAGPSRPCPHAAAPIKPLTPLTTPQ